MEPGQPIAAAAAAAAKVPLSEQAESSRDPGADGYANVDGRSAPRTPHERDESADSGAGAPREIIQKGHDDVVAGRTGTDKGEATDEVYRRTLRGKTPGRSRD